MTTAQKPSTIKISRKRIKSLVHDNEKSAKAINLIYVSDKEKGISRIKKGGKFIYTFDGRQVNKTTDLARIKALVLPPAWEQVWICITANGHLQATGIDTAGRKQYRYHPLWSALRSETKFFHMYDFGIALCEMRKKVNSDLSLPGLPQQKVLAAVVTLMENTGIRIGNNVYEKLYGSFGLTTLKDKHVQFKGSEMKFSFKGKKGVYQDITMKSRKLANIVKQCRDIPGQELFQYYDEAGLRRSIDSGMVNNYIKDLCGKGFTAKDFRTWTGTLCALEALVTAGCCDTEAGTKSNIITALDTTAAKLGNTRTVCRKYYVHPVIIDHYTNRTLEKYTIAATATSEYTLHEAILMAMLEDANKTTITL